MILEEETVTIDIDGSADNKDQKIDSKDENINNNDNDSVTEVRRKQKENSANEENTFNDYYVEPVNTFQDKPINLFHSVVCGSYSGVRSDECALPDDEGPGSVTREKAPIIVLHGLLGVYLYGPYSMYLQHVLTTYTYSMYLQHILTACSDSMFLLHVLTACTHSMYSQHALTACTLLSNTLSPHSNCSILTHPSQWLS